MPPTTSDTVRNLFHALGLAWILAGVGRLAWHIMQVRAKKRAFFGWELLYELPIAAFCGIAAFGLSDFLALKGAWQASFISVMAYLGPGGIEALFVKVVSGVGRGPDGPGKER